MRSAVIAFGIAFASLVPLSNEATAHGAGFGGGGGHFSHGSSFAHQHGRFGRFRQPNRWSQYGWWWPGYGGYTDSSPYAAADFGGYPPAVVYTAPAAAAPPCARIQETFTVAAESGGTRQVSVTRCRSE